MPGRLKVFLAQTRKPVSPAVLSTPMPGSSSPVPRPGEKSMAEKWAEYKREEKKSTKENSSGIQL